MHGGDRNRTSPFAFTGNKFEFRALGSSMSLSLPNTVLNTIVAEAIDDLAEELEDALDAGGTLEAALPQILQRSYAANKRIVFGGDNYSEEWHQEAEQARSAQPARHPGCAGLSDRRRNGHVVLQLRRALTARAGVPVRGLRSSST